MRCCSFASPHRLAMTEPAEPDRGRNTCCGEGPLTCVFSKALLAQTASCSCAQRTALGERLLLECDSPQGLANCHRWMALLRERARFALKLPTAGRPLLHQQALRLQCGSIEALQAALSANGCDTRQLVAAALERLDSPAELPWPALVSHVAHWRAQRRRRPSP